MINITQLRQIYTKVNKLSKGIDPITNQPTDILYLEDPNTKMLLSQLAEIVGNYGKILNTISDGFAFKIDKEIKCSFMVQPELINKLPVSSEPVTITTVANNINTNIVPNNMKKITAIQLNRWLMKQGYLTLNDGAKNKVPTVAGEQLGISSVEKLSVGVYYSPEAQRFIYSKLEEIAADLLVEGNGLGED